MTPEEFQNFKRLIKRRHVLSSKRKKASFKEKKRLVTALSNSINEYTSKIEELLYKTYIFQYVEESGKLLGYDFLFDLKRPVIEPLRGDLKFLRISLGALGDVIESHIESVDGYPVLQIISKDYRNAYKVRFLDFSGKFPKLKEGFVVFTDANQILIPGRKLPEGYDS